MVYMIRNKRLHIAVVVITIVYCYIFHVNCLIIPHNQMIYKPVIFTFFIYGYPERPQLQPDETLADGATGRLADMVWPITDEPETCSSDNTASYRAPEGYEHIDTLPVIVHTDAQANPVRPVIDDAEAVDQAESGRQAHSRTLLTADGVFKALTGLSLRDKLWIIGILSRCSIDQLLVIKSMLEGGVTWEENKAMFDILREKVTDEEQAKLDRLIEFYTQ
jgi:hypothetical protein